MKNLNSRWVKDYKEGEDKTKRVAQIRSYGPAFKELLQVLETLREEPDSNYTSQDWALRMAHINGANVKLKQVMDLISIEE